MKQDSYLLLQVDDILDMLGQLKWWLTLDLVSGYWQIPVHKDNIKKTAFMTHHSTFEFTVMPSRLTNAPVSFQLNWVSTLMYINNIIVFSQSFKEHLQHLQEVLSRLQEANMFIKPSKCNFCCQELPFLRHIVCWEGIAANLEKVHTVQEMATPVNVTKLQAFLGLCNYYHHFIPAFAKMAAPLYTFLNSKPAWGITWTEQCNTAFNNLKAVLTSVPVLVFPDFSLPFYLYTDVLKAAIGMVLAQKDENGHKCVVAYVSCWLLKLEKNYSVTEWECLSIVYWIEYFHWYLHGSKFYVVTDHVALWWLMEVKEQWGCLVCWVMKLQPYEFEIQYCAGELHANADALSCLPMALASVDVVCVLVEP